MGRKLITFLGANSYIPCHYQFGNQVSTYTRFVQTAIVELCYPDWSAEDEVLVFMTELARSVNWEDKKSPPPEDEGMQSAFRRILPQVKSVRPVMIGEGQAEDDIWNLFDTLYSELNEGDEVIFDVTHGFRSNPILVLTMLHYARFVKGVQINSILYGWFEKLGQVAQVKEMDARQRIAPLVDISSLSQLLDWTHGVDSYLRAGDASVIKAIVEDSAGEILKLHRGRDEEAQLLRLLASRLDNFTRTLSTCRGQSISETVTQLRNTLERVKEIEVKRFKPFAQLFDRIEEQLAPFTGNLIEDQLAAAKWCAEHGLYQQGYTFLQEGLFTSVCMVMGLDHLDKEHRQLVSSAINIVIDSKPEKDWEVKQENFALLKRITSFLAMYKEMLKVAKDLTDYRNSINHADMRRNKISIGKIISKLTEMIEQLEPFILEMSQLAKHPRIEEQHEVAEQTATQQPTRMFAVCSHTLTPEQLRQAREELGASQVVELPDELKPYWSNIPPENQWDDQYISPILQWLEKHALPGDIILIQGEFGATYRSVNWAVQHGYRPCYATTERVAEEHTLPDGRVETKRVFQHVNFRFYPVPE